MLYLAKWELELLYPIIGQHHTSFEEIDKAIEDDVEAFYADRQG